MTTPKKPRRPSQADYLSALDAPAPQPAAPSKRKTPLQRALGKAGHDLEGQGATLPKVRATFYVEAGIVERARNAAVQLMGPPTFSSLSAIVEAGLRHEVERLEKAHNRGKPFAPRPHDLKGGRPLR